MTSFAPMAQALLARPRWPAIPTTSNRSSAVQKADASKTQAMRAYLKERGSATSAELAIEADLDRASLVGALLKTDIKRGGVQYRAGRYHWNEEQDQELAQQLRDAAALLRKHGWRVAGPRTGA